MRIAFTRVEDADALGRAWCALEQRAQGSFFQSWTWTGCRFHERFANPFVLTAHRDARLIAAGLYNAAGGALHLGESGSPERDSIYIEHNGFLIEHGQPPDTPDRLLRHLHADARAIGQASGAKSVRLNGVDAAFLLRTSPPGRAGVPRLDPAWFADLSFGGPYLDRRGASTRQAIRQSRRYFQRFGPLTLTRAGSVAAADAFLTELIALHQAYWIARGKPGAFADPFFERFHRALIRRALPRDEIDLIRVATPGRLLGVLYNFRHRGRVLAYQSGFNHQDTDRRERPGLVAHVAAIEAYAADGLHAYDFLAGHSTFKASLSDSYNLLAWGRSTL